MARLSGRSCACLALLSLAPFALSCVDALPIPYIVKDLRIVSLVAEPPEVGPGETSTLTVYFAEAKGDVSVTIGRCPSRNDTSGTFDCAPADEIPLASGSAVPVSPGLASYSFAYAVPADLLDGHSALVATYGFAEILMVHGSDGVHPIDGLKRIVVSPGGLPDGTPRVRNKNPTFTDIDVLTLAGSLVGSATATPPLTLGGADTYRLLPLYDPDTLDPFTLYHYDGSTQAAAEEAIFSWSCATDCKLDRQSSFGFETAHVTPGKGQSGLRVFVVLRDGRGGEAFSVLDAALQ